MKKIIAALSIALLPLASMAQGPAYQSAFKAYDFYKSDNKDIESLTKAKTKIDECIATSVGKGEKEAKYWALRGKIYYAFFQKSINDNKAALKDITDASMRQKMAYGKADTTLFGEVLKSLEKTYVYDSINKAYQMEVAMLGMAIMPEVNNIAVGKYEAKEYATASEFYEASYETNKMMGKKDTNKILVAIGASQRVNDHKRVVELCDKMKAEKIATGLTYGYMYDAQVALGEKDKADKTLEEGLKKFPKESYLGRKYIEQMIAAGKYKDAIAGLDAQIAASPKECQLYLVRGNIYDNVANPKGKSGKDTTKPADFQDLAAKAEADYKFASECDKKNFDAAFNLGALRNNIGKYFLDISGKEKLNSPKQKEYEDLSTKYFGTAIEALKLALELKPCDKYTVMGLRQCYARVGQPEEAAKLKEACK